MEVSFKRNISVEDADLLIDELVELFSTQGSSIQPITDPALFKYNPNRYDTINQYVCNGMGNSTSLFLLNVTQWRGLDGKREKFVDLLFRPSATVSYINILWFGTSSLDGETTPIFHYYKGERIELLPLPRKTGHAYPLGNVWWTLCNIESWDLLIYKSEKPVYWVAYSPMLSGLVKNNQNNPRAVVYGPERSANIFINTIKQFVPLDKDTPSKFRDVSQVLLGSDHFPLYRLIECFNSLTSQSAEKQILEQWTDPVLRSTYTAELEKTIRGVRDLILEYCWVHWGDIELYIMLICTWAPPLENTPDYLCRWTRDT